MVAPLRIAATAAHVTTLGPGLRHVIWTQGCERACVGCLALEWRDPRGGEVRSVSSLVAEVLAADARRPIEGLTLSGGEVYRLQQPIDRGFQELCASVDPLRSSGMPVAGDPRRVPGLDCGFAAERECERPFRGRRVRLPLSGGLLARLASAHRPGGAQAARAAGAPPGRPARTDRSAAASFGRRSPDASATHALACIASARASAPMRKKCRCRHGRPASPP